MTIVTLASAALDANDPRRDACVYQYCGQLASYACTAPHGATVNLCEEHATGFGRVWGIVRELATDSEHSEPCDDAGCGACYEATRP
jgi:hypothetical protein